jgi:adenylyl-sulfate kinase
VKNNLKTNEIHPHHHSVGLQARSRIKGHQPLVIWLTGLSGSGKSTIANALEYRLVHDFQAHTYLLDGDNIRTGLNAGLGFSEQDRRENIRRIGEVAKLMYNAGLIVLTAFISPFRADRDSVRDLLPQEAFWEVFVSCPLEVCLQRDPKGLYKKAVIGEISEFTGITSPYEPPNAPELVVETDKYNVGESVAIIIARMIEKKIIIK